MSSLISKWAIGTPDYVPKDTDVIALFRITPQEGVDPDRGRRRRRRRILHRHLDRGVDRPADRLRLYRAKAYRGRAGAQYRPRHQDRGAVFRLYRLRHRPVRGRLDRQPDRLDHRQRLRLQAAQGAAARRHAHSGRLSEDLPRAGRPGSSSSASASTNSAARCWARPPSPSSAFPAATTAAWSTRRSRAASTS